MKILATDKFNFKLKEFADSNLQKKLLLLIENVKKSNNTSSLVKQSTLGADNVYILKVDNYRLFFSVVNEDILFVDILLQGINNTSTQTTKNPVYNHRINPTYNHKINPVYNHQINPVYNHQINPIYNHKINPVYNHQINPIYNHKINPVYNHQINPAYNNNFDGLLFFDLKNSNDSYAIFADKELLVLLVFNKKNECNWIGIKRDNGFSIFTYPKMKYDGYLNFDSENGYNLFDVNGKWVSYAK